MAYRSPHNPFLTSLVFSLAIVNFPSLEFLFLIYSLFIFGCFGSSLMCLGFLHLQCMGFSFCGAWRLGHAVFISCDAWAQQLWFLGSRAQAQQLWCTSFIALRHVGTSWITIEPMSSSLAGRFLFTEPPVKPSHPQNFPTLIPERSCLSGFSPFEIF